MAGHIDAGGSERRFRAGGHELPAIDEIRAYGTNGGAQSGASALALVSAAFGLEAVAFLASPALELSAGLRDASVFVVRSSLLAASAAVSLLLLRGRRSRV